MVRLYTQSVGFSPLLSLVQAVVFLTLRHEPRRKHRLQQYPACFPLRCLEMCVLLFMLARILWSCLGSRCLAMAMAVLLSHVYTAVTWQGSTCYVLKICLQVFVLHVSFSLQLEWKQTPLTNFFCSVFNTTKWLLLRTYCYFQATLPKSWHSFGMRLQVIQVYVQNYYFPVSFVLLCLHFTEWLAGELVFCSPVRSVSKRWTLAAVNSRYMKVSKSNTTNCLVPVFKIYFTYARNKRRICLKVTSPLPLCTLHFFFFFFLCVIQEHILNDRSCNVKLYSI
jgi:hypothetical protein